MAERALRGMSIGARSMESEEGVEFAERMEAHYECPGGHEIVLPFAADADVPPTWQCRCGKIALLRDGELPEAKPGRTPRTHWDMLLERRTIAELDELLEERLELLRSGRLHMDRRSA